MAHGRKAGSWYEAAVQWAVEEGITEGTGNGNFSPNLTYDRAMCLTMLYRMQGSPLNEAAAAEPAEMTEDITLEDLGVYMLQQMIEMYRSPEIFPDVEQDSYYELAVVWGGMNGILTDDNTGTMQEGVKFRPDDPCNRSEMISFLYQTKLMEDAANTPVTDELADGVTIAFPREYFDLLYRSYSGIPDDEDGILVTVSEIASREAAEAMGQDPDELGAGELFSIGRVSEEEAQKLAGEDIGFPQSSTARPSRRCRKRSHGAPARKRPQQRQKRNLAGTAENTLSARYWYAASAAAPTAVRPICLAVKSVMCGAASTGWKTERGSASAPRPLPRQTSMTPLLRQ